MNIARLFHVLVIGGSILGASSCSSKDEHTDALPERVTNAADAAASVDGAPPATRDADDEQNCFCDTDHEQCCDGTTERPGFTCCWGTTC